MKCIVSPTDFIDCLNTYIDLNDVNRVFVGEHPKMDDRMSETDTVQQAVNRLAEELDADVIHFNGPILRPTDQRLISDCVTRIRGFLSAHQRKNWRIDYFEDGISNCHRDDNWPVRTTLQSDRSTAPW